MNTIKINKGNTLIIAHRGLSGIEKENTNAAFLAAGNHSYFGIETDIHKTVDGKYVIIHDDTTGRVAIDDLNVEQSTFDTLRWLLLCDTDGKKGRSDLRIPTLEEYIGICKKYEKAAVLELKYSFSKEEVYEIVTTIEELGYLENVIFISFHLSNLQHLREKYPTQSAQLLIGEFPDHLTDILINNHLDLDIEFHAIDRDKVEKLQELGIKVNCWTCDAAQDGEMLVSWGVDYITSNILE